MKAAKVIFKNREIFEKDPIDGVSIGYDEDNIFKWNITIVGPKDSPYEGGIFNAIMTFPQNYPLSPPTFQFTNNIFHPNIYKNGTVCMSILHNGSDAYGYENDSIRWNPTQGVNSVMLSLISILSDPNTESPANIDASNMFSKDVDEYKKRVRKIVQNSQL